MKSPASLAVCWILANTAGWAGTMGVFEALPNPFKPAACVIVGIAQWLALRTQLRISPWWFPGTSLAWLGGLWAGVVFAFFGIPNPLWAGGVGGSLAGILQCWILRRRASRPMLWLPVTVIASVAGWWAGYSVGMTFSSLTGTWLYILAGTSGGVVIGMLSAPGLIWMARHPRAQIVRVSGILLLLIASEMRSYAQTPPEEVRSRFVFSTYFGGGRTNGRAQSRGAGIAVDKKGYVYVAGRTQADDFPSVNAAQKEHAGGENDAFLAKLTPDGQKLVYSTVLGGGAMDFAERVAVDDSGNAYITGTTYSRNFPTTSQAAQRSFGGGDRDCFIAKFSADGKLAYSTFLGGDDTDRCTAIDVDSAGNAYVTGSSNSKRFAVLKGPPSEHPKTDWDVLAAKLDPSGSKFSYVVRFGGTAGLEPREGGMGGESGTGVRVNKDGAAYVAGFTDSSDFPVQGSEPVKFGLLGSKQGAAFVVRLDPGGSEIQASSYFGGEGIDTAAALALDPSGNVYVTGAMRGPSDNSVLAIKLDPRLRTVYSFSVPRLSGGSGYDIAVDAAGNAYVTGVGSRDFPRVNPMPMPQLFLTTQAIVIKLTPDGNKIAFSTPLGNSFQNSGAGIAVDSLGDIYVTGTTGFGGGANLTADFPTVRALQPQRINSTFQTFISKIAIR